MTRKESHWITLSQIKGHIAMWAVRQSPYPCPDDLAVVLERFDKIVRFRFDTAEMGYISRKDLRGMLEKLKTIREFQFWNERKNGRQGHGITSAFEPKGDPDDDFIDLDALIMNVVRSVFVELESEETPSCVSSEPTTSGWAESLRKLACIFR